MTNLLCKLALKAAAEQVTYRDLWFFESFARTSQKSSPEEDPWHCALRAVFVGTRLVLGCPKSCHPAPLSDTSPQQPLRVLLAPARDIFPVHLCLVLCCLLSPPRWPLSFKNTTPSPPPKHGSARLPLYLMLLNFSQSLGGFQALRRSPGRALSFNNIYHSPRCAETPPSHLW